MRAEKYYRTPISVFGLSDDLKKAKQKKRIKGRGGMVVNETIFYFHSNNERTKQHKNARIYKTHSKKIFLLECIFFSVSLLVFLSVLCDCFLKLKKNVCCWRLLFLPYFYASFFLSEKRFLFAIQINFHSFGKLGAKQ